MKLIHFHRFHDRGPGLGDVKPIVLVPSPVAAVVVPWTVKHRFDQPNQARLLL